MPLPNVMLLGSNPFIIPTNNHPALYDIMGRNVVFWPSFWLKNGLRSNRIPIPSKWALSWNVGKLFPELKLVTFHFQEPTNILVLILPCLHDCSIPRCTCLAHLKLFFSCSYLSLDPDKIQTQMATGHWSLGTCDGGEDQLSMALCNLFMAFSFRFCSTWLLMYKVASYVCIYSKTSFIQPSN